MRDKGYRDKYWNVYLNNPKTYKLLQYEPKRIQAIDRKLKQYSSTIQKGDHYRTIDSSLMSDKSPRAKIDNHVGFLLRDVSKLDPTTKDSVFGNNSTVSNYTRERTNHTSLKYIWNNTNTAHSDVSKAQQSPTSNKTNDLSNNISNDTTTNSNENIISDVENHLINFNSGRRFTVEKLKDIV